MTFASPQDEREREEELASWIRCLDVELAAGDISQEVYDNDAAYFRRTLLGDSQAGP